MSTSAEDAPSHTGAFEFGDFLLEVAVHRSRARLVEHDAPLRAPRRPKALGAVLCEHTPIYDECLPKRLTKQAADIVLGAASMFVPRAFLRSPITARSTHRTMPLRPQQFHGCLVSARHRGCSVTTTTRQSAVTMTAVHDGQSTHDAQLAETS